LNLGEIAGGGSAESFADVAGEHVGALDGSERLVVALGDGFFDEAFFQADAELGRAELDEVFGFEGGEVAQGLFEEGLFCGGASLTA
jgi:hypothetical protein